MTMSILHQPHEQSFRQPTQKLLSEIRDNLTKAIAAASCHADLRPLLKDLFAAQRHTVRIGLGQELR